MWPHFKVLLTFYQIYLQSSVYTQVENMGLTFSNTIKLKRKAMQHYSRLFWKKAQKKTKIYKKVVFKITSRIWNITVLYILHLSLNR